MVNGINAISAPALNVSSTASRGVKYCAIPAISNASVTIKPSNFNCSRSKSVNIGRDKVAGRICFSPFVVIKVESSSAGN